MLLNGEEARCHPGDSTLTVSAHVVVEMLKMALVLEEREEVLVRLISVMQRRIVRIGGVLPPALAVELVELELRSS